MYLTLRDNLLFITVAVVIQDRQIEIPDVVLDTGSANTLLSADSLAAINLAPNPDDVLYTVRGVGGAEVVFARQIDQLCIGSHCARNFEIEVGGMDYGFTINGIIGTDFLLLKGAIIDLNTLTLEFQK